VKRPSLPIADEGALGLYLREIGKLQPLTSEQEAKIAARIRKNDRGALDTLVKANLRFVVSVARNYQNQGLALSDLINEGNVGLVRAARRFDEKKNFRFISYAVWWIRQSILQALADQSRIMRLPLNKAGAIHKISKTQTVLEQKHHRQPTAAEIAGVLELTENSVKETISIASNHISLDAPVRDNDSSTLLDILQHGDGSGLPDDGMQSISLQTEVVRALDVLTVREKEIVKLYFGIENETAYTLDEIGRRYNITRERVRQIKSKAIERLKLSAGVGALREFRG
jgi:RNA polymerase primary sigma factor